VLKHAVNARLRALRSHKGGQFGLLRKMEKGRRRDAHAMSDFGDTALMEQPNTGNNGQSYELTPYSRIAPFTR
jgi:hypothetical protein